MTVFEGFPFSPFKITMPNVNINIAESSTAEIFSHEDKPVKPKSNFSFIKDTKDLKCSLKKDFAMFGSTSLS
jgi:hypothetical protein